MLVVSPCGLATLYSPPLQCLLLVRFVKRACSEGWHQRNAHRGEASGGTFTVERTVTRTRAQRWLQSAIANIRRLIRIPYKYSCGLLRPGVKSLCRLARSSIMRHCNKLKRTCSLLSQPSQYPQVVNLIVDAPQPLQVIFSFSIRRYRR